MRGFLHELDGLTQLIRRLHADPAFHSNTSQSLRYHRITTGRLVPRRPPSSCGPLVADLQEQLEGAVARAGRAGAALAAALRALEAGDGGNDARARIARLQYACARTQCAAALQRHHAALHALQGERRALLHRQIQLSKAARTLADARRSALAHRTHRPPLTLLVFQQTLT